MKKSWVKSLLPLICASLMLPGTVSASAAGRMTAAASAEIAAQEADSFSERQMPAEDGTAAADLPEGILPPSGQEDPSVSGTGDDGVSAETPAAEEQTEISGEETALLPSAADGEQEGEDSGEPGEGIPEEQLTEAELRIRDFVTRLYQLCLGREPDLAGLTAWVQGILSGARTGAETAYGFVFSNEYLQERAGDAEYIAMLYRTILGREPDEDGLAFWQEYLQNGFSRKFVFSGVVNSEEFRNLCAAYGISAGSYSSDDYFDNHAHQTSFVARLYRYFLGRYPDAAGKSTWVRGLVSRKITAADAVIGFCLSREFAQRGLSHEEVVEAFYHACFDRDSDAKGKKTWVGALDKGVTLRYIAAGFVGSPEFSDLCRRYGLAQGRVTLTDGRDRFPNVSAYVQEFYRAALGRELNDAAASTYITPLGEKTMAGPTFVEKFYTAAAYKNQNKDNEAFVTDLYRTVLGREPDAGGLASFQRMLENGKSRTDVLKLIAASAEAKARYKKYGISEVVTGPVTMNGKTYYFENGVIQKNKRPFSYNDAWYRTDAEGVMEKLSDAQVRASNLTWTFINAHSSESQSNEQRFRTCFNWLLSYMYYKPKAFSASDFEGDDWPYNYVIRVLESTPRGNCYGFACTVASIARELGYEPYVIVMTADHAVVRIGDKYYDNMGGGLFGASAPANRNYRIYKQAKF